MALGRCFISTAYLSFTFIYVCMHIFAGSPLYSVVILGLPPPSSELAPLLLRAWHTQLPAQNPLPSPTWLYSEDTLHPLRVASCSCV